MIKIEITDPHLLDKKVLEGTARFLLELAGGKMIHVPVPVYDTPLPVAASVPNPPPIPIAPPVIVDNDPLGLVADVEAEVELTKPTQPAFNPFAAKVPPAPLVMDDSLDVRGFPWDERIHSRTKSKTHEGAWKYQRGMSSKVIDKIEEEIKASGRCLNITDLQEASELVNPPAIPTPPAPVVDAEVIDFQSVMQKITEAMVAGTLTREGVFNMLKGYGIPALPLFSLAPGCNPWH